MHLPYNPPYQSIWTTIVEDGLSRKAWDRLFAEEARRRSDAILAALVADAWTIPDYLAICMTTATAHDYEFQTVVLQSRMWRIMETQRPADDLLRDTHGSRADIEISSDPARYKLSAR